MWQRGARGMLTVTLPWPEPSLAPNLKNGQHWGSTHTAKSRRMADARYLVLHAMRQQQYMPPAGLLALAVTFCAPDKRRRDLDNLLASLKADFDGVSQALGVDDQLFEPITLKRGPTGRPGKVVLEIGVCAA